MPVSIETSYDTLHSINYAVDSWVQRSWYNPDNDRCYQAELKQDLFGEWVLIRNWGSANRRGSQQLETVCNGYNEGLLLIDKIAKRRRQRGYQ